MKWFRNLFTLGVCAFAATGCRHGGTPEQKADWVVSKMTRELDLSAEQKTKLDALKLAVLATRAGARTDRKDAVSEIRAAILSDRLDAAKAKSAIEKHQELRRKRFDDGFETVFPKLADFHASLSVEQKSKAVAWLDQFLHRFED